MSELSEVQVFTDGACRGNPGPGGWAAILRYRGREKDLGGFEPETTNNRMEMTAAIAGLEALKRPCRVRLYSDSQYLRDGITKWINGWKRGGWLTASMPPRLRTTSPGSGYAVIPVIPKTSGPMRWRALVSPKQTESRVYRGWGPVRPPLQDFKHCLGAGDFYLARLCFDVKGPNDAVVD